MPGSPTTPDLADARTIASARFAFRCLNSVGIRESFSFAAQWLAYTLPYRRFADTLAGACARLGADVGCYSFIVVDSHHLLLAGLPAHSSRKSQGEDWERNDRLIAIAVHSQTHDDAKSISDLRTSLIEKIKQFFVTYNKRRGGSLN